ncbi:hypothetical protein BGW80DRAFT_1330786 [Lactifluus volemus]|nr:hypothetical protein BGW80DRAFT_1330786 [Lactifluus volemus]
MSASSGQGTAVVSPTGIALNVAAAVGQDAQRTGRYEYDECGASFSQKKARTHHFKDKHLRPGTCPNCLWFTWPRGRPGLLPAHQNEYHMPSVFDD